MDAGQNLADRILDRFGTPKLSAESIGNGGYYATNPADGRIILPRDIEILPAKPRPELASYETRAFEAVDKQLGNQPKLALLCGRSRGPRISAIASYRNLKNPHILKLVSAGIVNWLPENRQLFAFAFDMPPARCLMKMSDAKPYAISEDKIFQSLIQPAISVLADLHAANLVHGALMPDNIFIAGGEGVEVAILGECLTSAPFMRLHPLFETIERGMAQPSGRGPGSIKNDLYALGVNVALVLRGQNLAANRSREQIVQTKIEQGSYGSLMGDLRVPAQLSEFLRGVLHDDEAIRWGIDDAVRWVEGRRQATRPPQVNMRATRPFMFREKKYWDMRSLSMALSMHVADAAAVLDKDQVDLWLKRNFDDKELEQRISRLSTNEDDKNRYVAGVCMALDPHAPIRYKGLSVMPDGFGVALSDTMAREEDIQPYVEMISLQLFSVWLNQRFEDLPDATSQITLFEKCRHYLTQRMAGYGIERCVYVLNPEAVCMSAALKDYFVLSAGHLVLALEGLSRRADRPEHVLDRHMIAFISVRESKMIDPHLGHIISHDKGYQVVGVVRTLAALQRRFQIPPVPGLGNWLITTLGPALEKFNDRDLRREIAQKLEKLVDSGNLSAILELIDSQPVVQDDVTRFAMARREFAFLMREALMIQGQLKRPQNFGRATGRQIAMLLSAVMGGLGILGVALMHFLE